MLGQAPSPDESPDDKSVINNRQNHTDHHCPHNPLHMVNKPLTKVAKPLRDILASAIFHELKIL
jgi:hypothetical protein